MQADDLGCTNWENPDEATIIYRSDLAGAEKLQNKRRNDHERELD